MTDKSCEFCRLIEKKGSATVIFEDEMTMAFLEIRPVNDVHTLVIPKAQFENICDIPEDKISYL